MFVYIDETHFDYRDSNHLWMVCDRYRRRISRRESWSLLGAISFGGMEHYAIKNTEHHNGVKARYFYEYISDLILSFDESIRHEYAKIIELMH